MAPIHAIVTIIGIMVGLSRGFSTGGPPYSCRNLIPGHSNGTQSDPPPYSVSVRNSVIGPGDSTTVVLESTTDFPFKGFLCAVSSLNDNDNNTLGMMSLQPSSSFSSPDLLQSVNCSRSGPHTGMTHVTDGDKYFVEFQWSAPEDAMMGDQYKLRCSVIMTFFRCWTNLGAVITIGSSTTGSGTTGASSSGATGFSNNMGNTGSPNMNNNNNNGGIGVSGSGTQSTGSPGNFNNAALFNTPTMTNNPPAVLQTTPLNNGNTGSANANFNPTTSLFNSNPSNTFGTGNGFVQPNPTPFQPANPSGFNPPPSTPLFNTNPNNLNGNLFSGFPMDDDVALPPMNPRFSFGGMAPDPNFNSILTNPNLPTLLIQGSASPNPGNPTRATTGINRNNNDGRNLPRPSPTNNNNARRFQNTPRPPTRPNFVNQNLVRTDERFADSNRMADFGFNFPSSFFFTPNALRRFRERNSFFQNN